MASVNLDISSRLDITCRKNDTFSLVLNIKDASGTAINVTTDNYTFEMEVRASTDATGTIIPDSEITTSGDSDGTLTITISNSDMAKDAGTYVYDLQATKVSDSSVTTWLYGTFTINEDVTE